MRPTLLWQAIDGLPAELKVTLLLRDVVGLSYAEIGEVLEITPSTVGLRIFKARERVVLALSRDRAEIALGDAEGAEARPG